MLASLVVSEDTEKVGLPVAGPQVLPVADQVHIGDPYNMKGCLKAHVQPAEDFISLQAVGKAHELDAAVYTRYGIAPQRF